MLNTIKPDKWRHFFVGVGMGLLFEGLLRYFFPAFIWTGSLLVLLLVAVISYGFEVASLVFKRGHYDVMDAVAGVVGGVVGMALFVLIIQLLVR